ncbi:Rdx family-domain-containing protein [Cercophora newfieldiana]|uniref:Rdx family-domain-containing protein n=1 Tax=Cercophora newfieldiana TaxID=92897 RepID=A0AA39Y516_9PEZI|nr:Rdx family-domain-containing protein [Cercophora newfieldiana]
MTSTTTTTPPLPRITIQFCTQCKWLLRAAYFAQELLSTFSTSIGEVALQPTTGGIFTVSILAPSPDATATEAKVLWDRKVDGGFPETKELKRRVRDVIEPGRNLGHVDRDYGQAKMGGEKATGGEKGVGEGEVKGGEACIVEGGDCKDCE